MLLEETLREMNRLKSNCSAKRSIYALLMVHCLLLLFRYGHACAPNPCTESMPRIHASDPCMIATVGLGVSDFGYRIFGFGGFMHGFGAKATWLLRGEEGDVAS